MGKLRLGVILFAAVLTVPAGAAQAGQKVHKPETAEEVIVIQAGSGEELHGRLLELSPSTLAILVDGRRVDVPIDAVLRIDTRHDSVKEGAVIGAAIAGVLVGLACGSAEGGAECVPATIIDAGLGALVGAGIDALHKGRTPIYIKAGKTAAGLQLKFSW